MKDKNSTVKQITEYISKEIMYGNLKSEEHLKEAKIAKLFGVSRVPVREALRILHSEGYVEMIPNRGSFVKKITVQHLMEIAKVYLLLAPEMLNSAIPHYKDSTYKKAYVALSRMEKCKEPNKIGYLAWDFAKIIFGPTEFKFMYSVLEEMYKSNIRMLNNLYIVRQYKHVFNLTPHKKFLELCKKNKKDQAVKVWCDYVYEISLSLNNLNSPVKQK
ncbi:MAG TPA: GntR family transcriptional regulator [Ignavibacteria bacterium]|nr:GntR family transcriptional regulator [Ignavibacteria bacterium]